MDHHLPLRETFVISRPMWEQMLAHVRAAYPLEGCGIVAGRAWQPTVFYPTANAEQSETRYSLSPTELLHVMQDMDRRQLDLLAIFHSHPATAAYPSETDMRLAFYPDSLYLIVSLADPAQPVLRGFWLRDGAVVEHPVQIDDLRTP